MADAAKATPKKKVSKPKKPAAHPKYSELIAAADGVLKNFKVVKNEKSVNSHLKLALGSGVKKGFFKASKGTGASGSFHLGEKPKAVILKFHSCIILLYLFDYNPTVSNFPYQYAHKIFKGSRCHLAAAYKVTVDAGGSEKSAHRGNIISSRSKFESFTVSSNLL